MLEAPPRTDALPMPMEMVTESNFEPTLGWLAALNAAPIPGIPDVDYTQVAIPAGSLLYFDETIPLFRMKTPEGKILAWDGYKRLTFNPGEYWGITWFEPGQSDEIDFGFTIENGELQILSQFMEGNEHLFADFVATFSDRRMCPDFVMVPDGRYPSHTSVEFMVTWGGKGVAPSLLPVAETLIRPPNLPAEFMVRITQQANVYCNNAKAVIAVEAGFYLCDVRSHEVQTGEVNNIRFRTPEGMRRFSTTGAELYRLIEEDKLVLTRIIRDRRPRY